MTTILAPSTADTSTADQIIHTLATYVDEHAMALGGDHQRTMLLAALITRLFDTPAEQAIDLARNDAFDERVKAAGQARDEILARVHRARLTREDWTPNVGDTVTWRGLEWIIAEHEDDTHVWLTRHHDVEPATAAATFFNHLTDMGVHFGPLAAIADLRPADASEVTV